jgi:hypothetical protein
MNELKAPPMIDIVLGHRQKAIDPLPKWSGHTGKLLYAEKDSRLFWVWLPEKMDADDNCAGARGNGQGTILLGDFDSHNKDGRLALLQLEPAQVTEIERVLTSLDPQASDLASALPSTIDMSQSLEAYVHSANPDLPTLRSIARYLSSQIKSVPEDGLSPLLTQCTFGDLPGAHPASARVYVQRDPTLAAELRKAVQERRIVFISGGTKSGLTRFLEQFGEAFNGQAPAGAHLRADFEPATFKEIVEILTKNEVFSGMLQRRSCDLEIASLLMSMAYDAYTKLTESASVDLQLLARFISPRAATVLEEFVFSYFREFDGSSGSAVGSGSRKSQIEPFLAFVGKLMEAAGKGGTLTVILSFPGLTDWLNETRGETTADRVSRSLWRELGAFATTNYNPSSGVPRPDSSISQLAPNVGIVIETQRLAVQDVTEGFCKHSILMMPPLTRSELESLWQQRTRTLSTDDILECIEINTGGAPWFVELVLDCFEVSVTSKKLKDRLDSAILLATNIVLGNDKLLPSPEIDVLRKNWALYVNDLKRRFSRGALTNRQALFDLYRAANGAVKLSPTNQAAEWLESGLIWLKPKQGTHPLRALRTYPYVATYQTPTLISLCIDSLTETEIVS